MQNIINQILTDAKQAGLYRRRDVMGSTNDLLHFSSNDYLSLTRDPRVVSAYQRGFDLYPAGSGGSMVVCGYHDVHRELEKAFALALGVDDCLIFSSGSAANISVVQLLKYLNAHVIIDKSVHASIYDGLTNSNINYTRYLHNNFTDFQNKIDNCDQNSILFVESIFSMSGSIAPLRDLANTLKNNNQFMIVDEAHAFGIIGHDGLGGVVEAHLTQNEVPLRVIPLGKSGAAYGAIVAGKADWIDALLQKSRTYIYSTGMSPGYAYGLLQTLSIIRGASERREKLWDLVKYFRQKIINSPLTWRDSHTPIQQLQLGCPHLALKYATKLREKLIVCLPMRQPTVTLNETGLRIILNYNHEYKNIDQLFTVLHEIS